MYTFNGQISYTQTICNIRKISEHMQASSLNICKQVAGNFVNESGNVPRKGVVSRLSDLEIMAFEYDNKICSSHVRF